MQRHINLQCPFCGSYTDRCWDDLDTRPSEDFDQYFLGVTCSDCSEYYEIAYEPTHLLYWEDEEMQSTENTVPPRNRPETP